jgi:hypothetical protein
MREKKNASTNEVVDLVAAGRHRPVHGHALCHEKSIVACPRRARGAAV